MNSPLVSVIVPAYNAGKFIAEAIDSVLLQEHENLELIIVNDGSTDDTEKIIHTFTDKRIRYYKQENKGVSAARNLALRQMKGTYFCFLDADDVLSPRSLSSRLELFIHDPELTFADGKIEKRTEDLKEVIRTYTPNFKGNPFNELLSLSGNCFFGVSWLIKKEDDKTYHFPEQMKHGEDLLFFISISRKGSYAYTNELIMQYRKNHGSAMSDLDGLGKGYKQLLEDLERSGVTRKEQLNTMRSKISSIMFRSYLKNGNLIKAVRSLFKY